MRPGLRRAAALLVLASAALGSAGRAGASAIAVKRGQTAFNPRDLPLVCIEVATVGSAIPLDSIVLEDGAHAEVKLTVTSVFGSSHPDLLTAYTPAHESLSLPIMRLKPGRYVLKELEFVGLPGVRGATTISFTVSTPVHVVWFEVKPGCVNYVGGVSIWADWNAAAAGVATRDNVQSVHQTRFASQTSATGPGPGRQVGMRRHPLHDSAAARRLPAPRQLTGSRVWHIYCSG